MSLDLTGNGVPASSSTNIDPAEFENIRNQAREYEQQLQNTQRFLEDLDPHKDIVQFALENPEYAQVMRNSVNAYRTLQEQQKPQTPPEFEPVMQKLAKLDELSEFVSGLKQERDSYKQQQDRDAFIQRTAASAQKLSEKYPYLAEDNWAPAARFATYAQAQNISFEDAVEQFAPVLRSKDPVVNAPTLRSGAGQTGVPSQSLPAPMSPGERLAQLAKQSAGV